MGSCTTLDNYKSAFCFLLWTTVVPGSHLDISYQFTVLSAMIRSKTTADAFRTLVGFTPPSSTKTPPPKTTVVFTGYVSDVSRQAH